MFFRQLLHEERSCLSYVIGCPTYTSCVVIDPQGDIERYTAIAAKRGLKIEAVFDTHIHADHVSIAPELAAASGAQLFYGPGADVQYPHTELKEGEVLTFGNRKIMVMHTPGHTAEHVCLYVDEWCVFTGDSLFVGDVGRVDLALTDVNQDQLRTKAGNLYESIQKICALPEWTEIFPGHYAGSVCGKGMDGKPVSTIGREMRKNAVLKMDRENFIDYVLKDIPPLPEGFEQNKRHNIGAER